MSVLHCHFLCIETKTLCEVSHIRSVIVAHKEIALDCVRHAEQLRMVNLSVFIESAPSNSIWWINEENCPGTMSIISNELNTIPANKADTISHQRDSLYAPRRVCAYQRDFTPLPFSPRFIRLAPGAIIPPRCTRFRTMVAKARSRSPLG